MKSKTPAKKAAPAAPKAGKDLKPKKDAKGGIGMLLPAVQKVRDGG